MNKSVKFQTVAHLLQGLGFKFETIPGSHHLFTHSETDSTLMLPPGRDDVRPAFLLAIARTLDERGLMARDDFEAALFRGENGHAKRAKRKEPAA